MIHLISQWPFQTQHKAHGWKFTPVVHRWGTGIQPNSVLSVAEPLEVRILGLWSNCQLLPNLRGVAFLPWVLVFSSLIWGCCATCFYVAFLPVLMFSEARARAFPRNKCFQYSEDPISSWGGNVEIKGPHLLSPWLSWGWRAGKLTCWCYSRIQFNFCKSQFLHFQMRKRKEENEMVHTGPQRNKTTTVNIGIL